LTSRKKPAPPEHPRKSAVAHRCPPVAGSNSLRQNKENATTRHREDKLRARIHRFLSIAILGAVVMTTAASAEDIVLRGMGSFHIGGRIAEVKGKEVRMIVRQPGGPLTKLDPNGQYMVEQMYVQYFLPKNRKGKFPLLMWHGGGLTGVTYESTPDGRDGWLNMFVRFGWDTYVSDAVERGRSGFASSDVWPDAPIFL